jgi:hypothetical protein
MTFIGHFDVWLTNWEQSLLEQTHHLMPDSPTIAGWVNGDLYTPAGETVGIPSIPDLTHAATDLQSYTEDKMKHSFLAWQQGTKYAVILVHTMEEKVLFNTLMQDHLGNLGSTRDWKKGVLLWNQSANGKTIFYKVHCSIITDINCSKLLML